MIVTVVTSVTSIRVTVSVTLVFPYGQRTRQTNYSLTTDYQLILLQIVIIITMEVAFYLQVFIVLAAGKKNI